MKALVVGGTDHDGPHLVRGLIRRAATRSRSSIAAPQKADEIPPQVERIHGDPHFRGNHRH